MKVWKIIWKTLLLYGCVIAGSLIFISAMVGAFLMDLCDYFSRLEGGNNIGGFSLTLTIGLLENLGVVWPIFAASGLCIGIMMAWPEYKELLSHETIKKDKLN
jgi:hypothetical protein